LQVVGNRITGISIYLSSGVYVDLALQWDETHTLNKSTCALRIGEIIAGLLCLVTAISHLKLCETISWQLPKTGKVRCAGLC